MARRADVAPAAAGQPRGETVLPNGGPVYVDPNIDPARLSGAAAYAAGIMARRGGLPKADMPLQQERPPIPVLSGGPQPGAGGQTMADFARAERGQGPRDPLMAQVFPQAQGASIIEESAPMPSPGRTAPAQRHTAASLGLAPADTLPDAARSDPSFQHGYGSEFASNQPHLAAKYGVVRNGQLIPPQRLGGSLGRSTLSPQTVEDLARLKQLQEQGTAPGLDESEEAGRKVVEGGVGGSAARVGGVSSGPPVKPKEETEESRNEVLKRAIDQMDAFEFNQWRQLTMRQILHSEEERAIIEGRLRPLDLGDLLKDGVIRQRVPIIPGKYEITLQSYDGQIELALKRLVMSEARSVDVGEQYLLDKHSFMSLAVGLHKINDKPYPDIFDKEGVFSDELFFKKFNQVMRLPIHMLASIGVNQMWFEMRVRKLYSASAVGNG
jgi:hypothetical protein